MLYHIEREAMMKKIIILMAVAFGLAAGSVTVMTAHSHKAVAMHACRAQNCR